jgi:cytochrome P450
MPPRAGRHLGAVGASVGLLRDPTSFLGTSRLQVGDTFVADALGRRLFFVFSPEGVRALYGFAEREASFGLATFALVQPKVPDELWDGRRNTPHSLFGRQDTERYLGNLSAAIEDELDELGRSGRFDVFARCRRLGHRLGLASWAGREASSPRHLDRLVPLLDSLDPSDAFVRPAAQLITAATRKRRERDAMHGIERVIGEILAERHATRQSPGDFLDQIYDSFADLQPLARDIATARDLIVIHMGSQSNLYAALAWTLIRIVSRPDLVAAVRAGDDDLLERCAYESIRMAQRSITLRQVLRPVSIDDGVRTYRLQPGVLIATMLSVTNISAAPGLDTFDPDHYQGRRLAPGVEPATKELVSTFGHGIHTCPAQRFSISAIRMVIRGLIDRYELSVTSTPEPRRRQLGGVARAEQVCGMRYRARA